jgi:zinc transporter ZupT
MESLMKINDPILLALIATGFTWFMTALGAAMVFFFKEINKRVLNMMLGFADINEIVKAAKNSTLTIKDNSEQERK